MAKRTQRAPGLGTEHATLPADAVPPDTTGQDQNCTTFFLTSHKGGRVEAEVASRI